MSFPVGRAGLAALVLAIGGPAWAGAPEQTLLPHRAVYDLTLAQVEPSVSILSVTGRLIYELEGSWCDGYTVTSTFQTNTVDREGAMSTTDLRTSTFETLDPAEFSFLNQTFEGGKVQSVIDGKARGTPAGTLVEINKPKRATYEFSRAVFPTQHTHLVLGAAANGERVLEIPMYDGGGSADTVYDTTTVIGPAELDLPGATQREREALQALDDAGAIPAHNVSISYFEKGAASGETVPDYVISFRMLNNGISYNATFDYGTFVLNGHVSELEVRSEPLCTVSAKAE